MQTVPRAAPTASEVGGPLAAFFVSTKPTNIPYLRSAQATGAMEQKRQRRIGLDLCDQQQRGTALSSSLAWQVLAVDLSITVNSYYYCK